MTELTHYTGHDIETSERMATVAAVADHHASQHVFADYITRKAQNTIKAQRFDLTVFAEYLAHAGVCADADQLQNTPDAWRGVSWGIVEGFVKWQLKQGHAIASINRRLSTVKTYAKLAAKAWQGTATAEEKIAITSWLTMIRAVSGYGGKEAKRINEHRTVTRVGDKKAEHVSIDDEQAQQLKTHPDTPQGRRDAVLMCLLLDHGLRAGEVAALQVHHVDLKNGVMRFYRPKVDKEQNHKLTADTLRALRAWLDSGDAPAMGALLRGSRKGGHLTDAGMSTTSISERVRYLGKNLGIDNLSAHDCRHYWATRWAGKVDVLRLQEAGGWNSLAMPRRYVEHAKIANEGMA